MSDTGKVWVVDPTDGQTRQVAAEEAQQGFQAGKLQLPSNADVHMTADDGTTRLFPASSVQAALAKGWRMSNAHEVLQAKAETQPLQAGLEAAASELTFGATDVAARELGVEGLRERRDTTAGQVGKYTGMAAQILGPGLLEKAAGTVGKNVALQAAEAALSPMRALTAAGDAVEAAAGKALAGTITSEAAAKAASAGLGRAVEGAAFGAGANLSEEALGNPDANAQSFLAAAGAGALLGGAVGGVAGAGLRGLGDVLEKRAYSAGRAAQAASVGARHYTPEEFQAAIEAANGGSPLSDEASKGVKGWLYNAYKKASSAVSGGEAADIDTVNSKFGQQVLLEGKQILESAGRKMRDVMNGMVDVQTKSSELAYGAVRKGVAAELMPKGAAGSVVADAGRALQAAHDQLDAMEADALANGWPPSVFSRFRDALNETEARLMKKAGVPVEYTERTRREVPGAFELSGGGIPEEEWQARKAARAAESRNAEAAAANERIGKSVFGTETVPPVPSLPRTPMVETPMTIEEIVTKRRGLKDLGEGAYNIPDSFQQDVYDEVNRLKQLFAKPGKFGVDVPFEAERALQKRFQDVYQGLRNHLEDEGVWGGAGKLQRDVNSAFKARADAWEELQNHFRFENGKIDPNSVANFLGKMDRMRGDRAVEALDAWQAANLKYAETLDKHFTGQSLGADARALNEQFSALRKDLDGRVQVFAAARRLRGASQERFGFGGNGGALAGALLGGFSPAGAVGGAVGEAILNPGRAALIRANLANIANKFRAHLDARVGRLVNGGKGLIPDIPVRSRMIAKSTLDMLRADTPQTRREAYAKRVEELTKLSDPMAFGDHAATQLLGLSEHVPQHAKAMSTTAAACMNILRATFPGARAGTHGDGGAFDTMFAKPVPHDRDIMKFAEVDHALQAPSDALLDAAERGYVPDHVVRAVEQAYPQVLQAIRYSITQHAGSLKRLPTHAQSRVFNQLLGGGLVPASKLQTMQAVHKQAASPAPQSSGSPKVKSQRSAGLMTSTDKLDNIYSK